MKNVYKRNNLMKNVYKRNNLMKNVYKRNNLMKNVYKRNNLMKNVYKRNNLMKNVVNKERWYRYLSGAFMFHWCYHQPMASNIQPHQWNFLNFNPSTDR